VATRDPPGANLCTSGDPALQPETVNPPHYYWNWTCTSASGATASCQSNVIVDGECAPYPNPISTAPNPECNVGTGSAVTEGPAPNTNWNWTCSGYNGGQTPTCSAPGLCAGTPPSGGTLGPFPGCAPTCPAGLTLVGNSCVCPAAPSVNWGQAQTSGSCTAALDQASPGGRDSLTSTAQGFNGTELATCTTSGWQFTGQTCSAVATNTCGTEAPSAVPPWTTSDWNTMCSGGGLYLGGPIQIPSASNGWTWQWTCYSELLNLGSANNCSSPGITCASTTETYGRCSSPIAELAAGEFETSANTVPNYAGQITATCGSSGTWSYSNSSCTRGCTATSNSYQNCNFNVPALQNGQTETPQTTTPNYTGQETATCNDGTFSYSNQSCTGGCPNGSFWNGASCVSGCTNPLTNQSVTFGSEYIISEPSRCSVTANGTIICAENHLECVFDTSVNQAGWTSIGCTGPGCGTGDSLDPIPSPYECSGCLQ
jgi:hypothetical protein